MGHRCGILQRLPLPAPGENISLARNFRMKERFNLQIRAEFANFSNRAILSNPTNTNAFATPTTSASKYTGGFGRINTATLQPRYYPHQGTLVARFTF